MNPRVFAVFLTSAVFLVSCGEKEPPVEVGSSKPDVTDTSGSLQESLHQAIEAAESILKITPNDPDALLAAALAAEHLGQKEQAIHYYVRLQAVTQETEYLRKLAELEQGVDDAAALRHAARYFEQGGEDEKLRIWAIRKYASGKMLREAFRLTENLSPPSSKAEREYLRDLCLAYSQSSGIASVESSIAIRRAASFDALPDNLAETAAMKFLAAGDAEAARDILKTYPGAAHSVRALIAEKMDRPEQALEQRLKYFYGGGTEPKELLELMAGLGRAPPAKQVAEALWRSREIDLRSRLEVARNLTQFYREYPDTASEIKFLQEARVLGDPALLERLADVQRAMGNARDALATLRARYPLAIPDSRSDFYVAQALSAGEPDEAIRVATQANLESLSLATRRRLSELLTALAEDDLRGGDIGRAKTSALLASKFLADLRTQRLQAKLAIAESDTSTALIRLKEALKISSTDPELNYLAGTIYFSQSRWNEAKFHLQIASAGRYPSNELSYLLGQIHFFEKSYAQAFSQLKEYALSRGNQVPARIQELLGRAALESGHPSDAALWFERRLAAGDDEQISADWIESLLSSGQKAKALGAARALAKKYPSSLSVQTSASHVFDLSADSPALLKALESISSLETDPARKSAAQRRLIDVHVKMGRSSEADAILTTLLGRFPDDPELLSLAWAIRKGTRAADPILHRLSKIRAPGDPIQLVRARQLLDSRQTSAAMDVIQSYLSINPEDASALCLQAEIQIHLGNSQAAAAAYRSALKFRSDDTARRWLIRYNYDQALSALASNRPLENSAGLYDESLRLLGPGETYQDLHEIFGKLFSKNRATRSRAIDAYAREMKITQDTKRRARLSETLGQWYLEDGQLGLAREMFSISQTSGNVSSEFLKAYAKLMLRTQDAAQAMEKYELVLKQNPYDREANLYLARVAADRHRPADALKHLEALRSASPADSGVLEALGRAYLALGRASQAADVLQRAAAADASGRIIDVYADALYESGRHKSALREYRKLYSGGRASPTHLRRLAELEQKHGNWPAAEEIGVMLLRLGGSDKDRAALSDVFRRMGDDAIRKGQAKEAMRIAERLLSLNENDANAFLLMGRAKVLSGAMSSAAESYSRALALSPKDPKAFLGLAEVELRQGRPVVTIDYARKAIAIDPTLPEAYTLMGLAYQKQGDVRQAYDALKQSLQHSKNRAAAHIRMGDLFLENKKYNVALGQYREALAADPKNPRAHLRNAVALSKLGFSENAMKELLTVIELDPEGEGSEARVLLSEIFISKGESGRARDLMSPVAAGSTSPSVLLRLGEMARRGGDPARGIQILRDALARSESAEMKYEILNSLGLTLEDAGDLPAAEATFKEAARLMPNRPSAFLNLALHFRKQKNFPSAAEYAKKSIVASSRNPEGYKLLGLIYFEAGMEKESLTAFRESLRLKPDQPEILNIVRSVEAPEGEEEGEGE